MRTILFSFCLALGLSACKTTKDISTLTKEDIQISLKKGGCFGKCPIYVFNIYKGGYAEFIGKKHTSKKGLHSLELDKDTYKEIVKTFNDAEYHQFEDNYESDIADLPTIVMSYNDGSQLKTITGKRERPERVHKLQFMLEQVAEKDAGWKYIGDGTDLEEKKPIQYIKSEIILQIKDAGQLARWFDNMRKTHSIRIIKQLSAANNTWLISYDKNKYLPNEILVILRNDENVSSAEFNVKSEER